MAIMTVEDQSAVIEFLASPAAHGGMPVDRIDTHSAIVFLAGERAYKLKRAVRFDYLDFSTADLRRTFCDAELRLNQRTAPAIYRRVVAVTLEADGSLALDGRGSAVDWLVEMNRFPQEALFDRLAGAGRLDLALMAPLANAIAAFHMRRPRAETTMAAQPACSGLSTAMPPGWPSSALAVWTGPPATS